MGRRNNDNNPMWNDVGRQRQDKKYPNKDVQL